MTIFPPGKMYRPIDITFETVATKSIFVVEQFNHRISKWDYTVTNYDFTLDTSWGSNGDGTSGEGGPIGDGGPTDNSLYRPSGIVNDNGVRLVVTDTLHNRIRTMSLTTGAWIDSVGQGGRGLGDFYHPRGIGTDFNNTLVVADELNHRAVKYDLGNTPSNPFVLADPTPKGFNRPVGVCFDNIVDNYNIMDTFHGVISRYSDSQVGPVFLDQYGAPGSTGTDLFFPGSGEGDLTGTVTTPFADARNNSLKTMRSSTLTNITGTTAGTGNGQLYHPQSAAAFRDTSTNYVFAANTFNNRVEAYSNLLFALTFQVNFGSP